MAATGKRALSVESTGRKRAGTSRWQAKPADRLVELGYAEAWFASPIRRHFRAGGKLLLVGDLPDRQVVASGAADEASFADAQRDLGRIADRATTNVRKVPALSKVHAMRSKGTA